jgi:hypothetical protein
MSENSFKKRGAGGEFHGNGGTVVFNLDTSRVMESNDSNTGGGYFELDTFVKNYNGDLLFTDRAYKINDISTQINKSTITTCQNLLKQPIAKEPTMNEFEFYGSKLSKTVHGKYHLIESDKSFSDQSKLNSGGKLIFNGHEIFLNENRYHYLAFNLIYNQKTENNSSYYEIKMLLSNNVNIFVADLLFNTDEFTKHSLLRKLTHYRTCDMAQSFFPLPHDLGYNLRLTVSKSILKGNTIKIFNESNEEIFTSTVALMQIVKSSNEDSVIVEVFEGGFSRFTLRLPFGIKHICYGDLKKVLDQSPSSQPSQHKSRMK